MRQIYREFNIESLQKKADKVKILLNFIGFLLSTFNKNLL